MARDHHSASSVSLIRRCPRAAAYKYLDGLEEPEVAWADVQAGAPCTSSQRARALGKAVHEHFEAWFRGTLDPAQWATLPGQIALSGAHLVPPPDAAGSCAVEHEFRVRAGDVEWLGLIDLWLHGENRGRGLIVDYKTTSNIDSYALTPEALATDLQACLYVAATGTVDVRWVYMQTGRGRKSKAVDARILVADAYRVVKAAADDARAFDRYERSEEAPQNPRSCDMFGGCPYHRLRGGPCDVRAMPSAFRKEMKMPLTLDKIRELKQTAEQVAPTNGAAEPAPAEAGAVKRGRKKAAKLQAALVDEPIGDDADDADDGVTGAPEPSQPPAQSRGRKKKAAKTAPAKRPTLTGDDAPMKIIALQDELREACEAVAEAEQVRDGLIERIGELCRS